MTGRGLRARAPVDYNKKDSMEPAWLKAIHSTKAPTPLKKQEKNKVQSPGSAEKENAATAKKSVQRAKATKQAKAADKSKAAATTEKKLKQKKASPKEEKAAPQPTRGRNAGLAVVTIGKSIPGVKPFSILSQYAAFFNI